MKITVTTAGDAELLAVLHDAGRDVVPEVEKVAARGALQVKRDWADRWRGLAHAPALPRAVSYDVDVRGTRVDAEIGPDKARRQGALGNLLEFGSVNNAPRPAGAPALAAEAPRFEAALATVGERLLS